MNDSSTMPLARRAAAVAHSLIVRELRALLVKTGERVGTPVAFLKAAWADPVLYGGLGGRLGTDLDILVGVDRFSAFAAALEAADYHRLVGQGRKATSDLDKEWVFARNTPYLHIDLHRGLANPPWFLQDPAGCLHRAIVYDSVDGEILSLCPEDQVVYAAVHHANSRFQLDGKHLEDTRRLLSEFPVDWNTVWHEAGAGYLEVPTVLLAEALRDLGADAPPDVSWLDFRGRARYGVAKRYVSTDSGLSRRWWRGRVMDSISLMPALSGRTTALPRFLVRFAVVRALDQVRHLRG